jgi:hypothetical protein
VDVRPISIHVFPGNASDSTIVMPILDKMRANYGLSKIVRVGDRGMITGKTIKILRSVDGMAGYLPLDSHRSKTWWTYKIKGADCSMIKISASL